MANKILVSLDYSEKFLGKIKSVTNNGFKLDVDLFKVIELHGHNVEVMFYKLIERKRLPILRKQKRMKFVDNKVYIKVNNLEYCIGTYIQE